MYACNEYMLTLVSGMPVKRVDCKLHWHALNRGGSLCHGSGVYGRLPAVGCCVGVGMPLTLRYPRWVTTMYSWDMFGTGTDPSFARSNRNPRRGLQFELECIVLGLYISIYFYICS